MGKASKAKLRVYQFRMNGKRRTLRFGRLDRDSFETLKAKLVSLIEAKAKGVQIGTDTAAWVGGLWATDKSLAEKLVEFGLIEPPVDHARRSMPTVKEFVEGYLNGRKDWQPRSLSNAWQAADALIEFLGATAKLDDVNAGTAKDFKNWLLDEDYAEATTARRIIYCREFFQDAIDRDLIAKNPFAKLKAGSQSNDARFRFVTREETTAIMEACPDAQWRAIVALARYGGLRTPSETLLVRLGDINWDRERITVRSPKTARHKGKGERIIPLFPELREPLLEVAELAAPGTVRLISRYPEDTANLRTEFHRIIRRAGLVPWERCFHNLRASRQNELMEQHPIHVVCAWIGNSVKVASEHYLKVRESDFEAASKKALPKALPAGAIRGHQGLSGSSRGVTSKPQIASRIVAFSEKNSDFTPQGGYARLDSNSRECLGDSKRGAAKSAASADRLAALFEALPADERAALLSRWAGERVE